MRPISACSASMTPAESRRRPVVMLSAGEVSGDLHGGALAAALRRLSPEVRLLGMGGERMAAAGVELLADARQMAIVGFTEALRRLPAVRRRFARLRDAMLTQHPDVLVTIDYPGFNLRLAEVARAADIPVVYFVPPQIWAWRAGRIRVIRERVSLVLAVFPFERPLYRQAGVPVEFVGHPIADALVGAPSRADARRRLGLAESDLVIGLLPGSRALEIARLTPIIRDAVATVASRHPRARFVLALAPTVTAADVSAHFGASQRIDVVTDAHAVMSASDLLLATSGTATLEAALLGAPMVVIYRFSWLSQMVGHAVLRIPWISLPNIILGRGVVPELFLRHEVTAERLAATALRLIETPGALDAQRSAFRELAAEVGEPGVAQRAAARVLSIIGTSQGRHESIGIPVTVSPRLAGAS
ncbi:MAG: lipid-A-disaccharide synthase [Candidatus Rokuibacteriota bacterium]|nr:MAG: lipid-A-disaccharide synthase [Candidatus Rokubacteria bacterium]